MQGSSLEYRALTDIDLTINDGEFLAVIGHTGSGKSTLIQHFNGLVQPTSGKVVVDGNHPLAGVALVFDVTVAEVRPATTEEITHGHVHGAGGHHH